MNALIVDKTQLNILPVGEGILLILRGVNLNESAVQSLISNKLKKILLYFRSLNARQSFNFSLT